MLNFLVVFWSFCLSESWFLQNKGFQGFNRQAVTSDPGPPQGCGSHRPRLSFSTQSRPLNAALSLWIQWRCDLMTCIFNERRRLCWPDTISRRWRMRTGPWWSRMQNPTRCFPFNLSFSRFSTSFSELNVRRWLWQSDMEKRRKVS